jgi:hypothetical protein
MAGRSVEGGAAVVRLGELGPVEVGPVEVGPVEVGPVEVGPVEGGPLEGDWGVRPSRDCALPSGVCDTTTGPPRSGPLPAAWTSPIAKNPATATPIRSAASDARRLMTSSMTAAEEKMLRLR